tara:strand:+ start:379 stop:1230 length:852 start_codon:yes stop_codon:yes gene_type:complete
MKIILGTAQFGLNYGVKNNFKKLSKSNIYRILDTAYKSGIFYLDTAESYGNVHQILSSYNLSRFKIITKINYTKNISESTIENSIYKIINSLKIKKLYSVLLHQPKKYKLNELKKIYLILLNLKKKKIINKIGFSIYKPEEYYSYKKYFSPDIVQGPLNIFNRNVITSNLLNDLKESKIEFHARSIFLQGLLLMTNRSRYFNKWDKYFKYFQDELKKTKLKDYEYAINFVKQEKLVSSIVFGVDNSSHVIKFNNALKLKNIQISPKLSIKDENIINPSNWNIL